MIRRSIDGPGMKYTGGHIRFLRIQPGAPGEINLGHWESIVTPP